MNGTEKYAGVHHFAFGDSPELADLLLSLVIAGTKTATCSALRDYQADGALLPTVRQLSIADDGKGRAAAVIETVEVTIKRFDEVDDVFAFDEGEGDRTLESWRREHESYFRRNGGFSPDMELVCERFRLVDLLDRDQG